MKKALSLFLALVTIISMLSFSTTSFSATKPYAEDKLIQIQKKSGFIPNKTAKVTGNCYGFVSAVCNQLFGVKYDGEGLYGNFRAQHGTGNYYTVKTYTTKKTYPNKTVNNGIKNFFVNNAQPGDVVHYGAYTTGSSNYSTHTFMIQHIDNEKMQIFHSNYETRSQSRSSCHIDTIVWSSFLDDSTKAVYNSDGTLYSHNNLFYNKMKQSGLGISINRFSNYSKKYQMVDNSETQAETQKMVLGKVTGLKKTSVTESSIGIKWENVEGADEYYIYVTNDTKGTNFDKTVTETSTTLNGLTKNNTYTIKVRATNDDGIGDYSDTITVKAKPKTKPKSSNVKNLEVTKRTTSTITLKWDAVSNASQYYILIENKITGGKYDKFVTTNSTTLRNFNSGDVYSIRVKEYNDKSSWGAFSDELITPTRPLKVKIKGVTSTESTKIRATWKKDAGNKTGYQIAFSTDKNFKKNVTLKYREVKDAKSYSKLGFTKNKKYYVKVRAYITVNEKKYFGSWSDILSVKCK